MCPEPARLLADFESLLPPASTLGPVLDLASGDCRNGLFLALKGFSVICCDRSREALDRARQMVPSAPSNVRFWEKDLESGEPRPLPENAYGAVLVFRYLHRPLMPFIRNAVRPGGFVFYETYTVDQRRFGKPRNPDHLLRPGELEGWFHDWIVHHSFEGILPDPDRAVAQLVAEKPRMRS